MANDQAIQDRIRKLEERRVALAQDQKLDYSMEKANELRRINKQINELQLEMMPR